MDGPPRGHPRARGAALGLRGAPAFLAAGTDLPAARRAAPRVRTRSGLHPRGADAGLRAPLRRLLGLPGHRLLRPDVPDGLAGRLPLPHRRAARGRDRRHRGLGARALPARRLGSRRVRRPSAVRALGSAAGRTPGLGHARIRLRPHRGAQLPRLQRHLLVRGVPHRRPAGRRGRLDALPRLLPRGRAVVAERARRPGEPGRRRLPPGDERDGLPAQPRCGDDRGGVHRLGRRHPRHPPCGPRRVRRSRLRAEVEHGLDARLPGVRVQGAGAPQVPPQRDDLLDGVRVQRELRPAHLSRRGRARQALARQQDARRLVAAACQPPRLSRLHVGPPRQATPFHGAGVRAGRGVVRGSRPGLVAARSVVRRGE